MKNVILIFFIFTSIKSFALTILNCYTHASSSITTENGVTFSKADGKVKTNKETKITLVIEGKNAYLKGNVSNVKLHPVGDNYFLEKTQGGNLIMWKYFKGSDSNTGFVTQQKSYDLFGPCTFTTVYKCE